jgi:hypothetical protein
VSALDGTWEVRRTGGLLPPLPSVRKHIDGTRGETRIGRLVGVPFDVVGLELRYHAPFTGFVDVLTETADGFSGRATAFGREFGRFEMRPVRA